jgi:hypothetical protein
MYDFLFGKFWVFWAEFCPNFAKQEIISETVDTPRLARNAHFARLGASRGCESVVLSVHMAQTKHAGRMFGQKTARKRPVTRGPDSDQRDPNKKLCLKL